MLEHQCIISPDGKQYYYFPSEGDTCFALNKRAFCFTPHGIELYECRDKKTRRCLFCLIGMVGNVIDADRWLTGNNDIRINRVLENKVVLNGY